MPFTPAHMAIDLPFLRQRMTSPIRLVILTFHDAAFCCGLISFPAKVTIQGLPS
jgi:hypothetical protein